MPRFYLLVILLTSPVLAALGDADTSLVIRNASVFDAASGKMLPHRTIVVRGDRIAAIGDSDQPIPVPADAELLDASGKFIIPGLIDAHVHLVHLADRTHVTGDEFLPLFLAAGVTTVRSAGDAIVAETGVANFAKSHPRLCPRVFLASPLIDRDPPLHRDVGIALTDPSQVAAFVDDMAAWNVTTLKIYVGTPRDIGQEVIRQGHRRGMRVTGHLGRYTAQDAAIDGIDCLEHIWSVFNYSIPAEVAKQPNHRADLDLHNPKCQDLIALLVNRQVAVDPTLVVFRNMIYLNDLEEVHKQPELVHVPQRMLRYWEGYRAGHTLKPSTLETRRQEILKYQELTGMLHRNGVLILAGTDSPEPYVIPGFSLHQELEMLVASGLSPADAIKSATVNNARILNQVSNLGSIEVGKWADLVILTADPTQDIRNTRKIDHIIRGGRIVKPSVLLESVPAE
jgi:imidazolonepropionase-like amidohydrolase